MKNLRKDHPRILLTDPRLAELKQQARSDKLLAQAVKAVLAQADANLSKKAPKYDKIGPRLLHVSRDVVERVMELGFAYRWTGKGKYRDEAVRVMLAAAKFKDWNPSHFLDTAEMAFGLGVGYDWLYDDLDDATRKAIRTAIVEKGLKPGQAAQKANAWWTRSAFNWNQVCNGGLAGAALAIADEEPELAEFIVSRAIQQMPTALKTYDPDGAWGEGPGYWGYATRYTVYGLASMETALGSTFGLADRPGMKAAALSPFYLTGPTGDYVCYADVGMKAARRRLPSVFYLARKHDLPAVAALELESLRAHGARVQDLLWFPPAKRSDPPTLKKDKYFRGIVPVAVFRSGWDDDALFVSLKGGYNRVNHGHLDLGQFELDARGVRWALDLGKDDYDLPGYWSGNTNDGQRWTYYRLNSQSHNVPLLDGQNQDVDAVARFRAFRAHPSSPHAVVDLTSTFPKRAKWIWRGVKMVQSRKAVLVQDEFDLKQPSDVRWAMATEASIHIGDETARKAVDGAGDDVAVLIQDGQTLVARILSPAGATFVQASARQKPPQAENKGIRQLQIRLPKTRQATIAVLLAPADVWGELEPVKLKPLGQWTGPIKDDRTDVTVDEHHRSPNSGKG